MVFDFDSRLVLFLIFDAPRCFENDSTSGGSPALHQEEPHRIAEEVVLAGRIWYKSGHIGEQKMNLLSCATVLLCDALVFEIWCFGGSDQNSNLSQA